MLILTRKPGESVYIGDTIKITIVEMKGNQIRVGIDAPREMRIYREEIYNQILEENKQAAESGTSPDDGLEGLAAAWSGRKGARPAISGGGLQGAVRLPKSASTTPEVIVKKKKRREDE